VRPPEKPLFYWVFRQPAKTRRAVRGRTDPKQGTTDPGKIRGMMFAVRQTFDESKRMSAMGH